ncbi:DUF1444 family protein [Chitinophaga sp. Cy-1792]|uniref:DUF1444 family protein n=1 Tax=Chitinophaga sp. Cy-1792 TaxID=2608339 RepID=UPI0014236DE1|nr:DUF1444 family protein [Chitinophaga sp. Cy-1792]NIG56961.1 DUF1444 family protein [Chitinophaga sp. Cy-1792]
MGLFNKLFGKKTQPSTTATNDSDTDLTKVYPRIKRLYNEASPNHSNDEPKIELGNADLPIYEPIAKDLGLFYALDMGDSFMLLQNRHLSETITLEKLREAAINNLVEETSEKTEIHGNASEVMMLANGGNYEAAMILINSLWDDLERTLNDQPCIALPARDLLFITGKNNAAGREHLRDLINRAYDTIDKNQLLVRHIYTRENNQWSVIETI